MPMTPKELLAWLQQQAEPAVPLESVPDHESLGVLMERGKAMAWASDDGRNWAAPTANPRRRPRPEKTHPETDIWPEFGHLDSFPSRSTDDVDPGLVADLAERAGRLVRGWERLGGRRAPWPVILFGGRQCWPAEGFAIRMRVKRTRKGRTELGLDMVQAGDACTVCRGAPLSPVAACLACGRWGLDHLVTREQAAGRAAGETIKFRPRAKRGKTG